MPEVLTKQRIAKIIGFLFLLFTIWWTVLQFFFHPIDLSQTSSTAKIFGSLYGIIALIGGLGGLQISQKWGGTKSVIGRAILMLSLGLLLQEFGQIVYSYYNYYLQLDPPPYPSIGDIGFFGSIPVYIYGTLLLARASGVKVGLRSFKSKIQAIVIPLIILSLGYYLFLQGYEFDWKNPVKIFLDFGYPLGQAIYISVALLTYLLCRNVLGGIMRNRVFFVLIALVIQFLSDWTFLYQISKGTWYVGGVNDYMYLIAYVIMALSIQEFSVVLRKLRE